MQSTFPKVCGFFQQDNDPKHRAYIIRDWLHTNGITVLDWPPYSPDLNPIENLWAVLKVKISARQPTTTAQLAHYIKEEWFSLPVSLCVRLVQSMPHRCEKLLQYRGYITKY